MSFRILDGDVFNDPDINILVQGCNCFCTMGSGVARVIHDEYPGAYEADQQTIRGDKSKLGNYTKWTGPHSRIPDKTITIVNAYTQYGFGSGKIFADYQAIENVMNKILVEFPSSYKIGMPFIGAGLAGGDPHVIAFIFDRVFGKAVQEARLILRPTEFPTIPRTL